MAAVTFNPLLLSAKASVRGAAVKRTAAKQSKRAAFTVKAPIHRVDGFSVRVMAPTTHHKACDSRRRMTW